MQTVRVMALALGLCGGLPASETSLLSSACSPDNMPSLFSGFGVVRFKDGTCIRMQ